MDQAIYELTVEQVGNDESGKPSVVLSCPHYEIVIRGDGDPMRAICRAFAAHLNDDASVFFKFTPAMTEEA